LRISPPAQFPKCIRVMVETPVRRSAIRRSRFSEGKCRATSRQNHG